MKRTRGAHRWLVFIHQLPAHPSKGRVKIWRRLQQIGAVAVKNAVHVLPNNAQSREDFEWLRTEVVALGGEATIFAASSIKGLDLNRIKVTAGPRKIAAIKRKASRSSNDLSELRGRVWITRPRPGVDRFSSAWLIRRFIDANARFVFGSSPDKTPDAVPFDMYQPVGFRHEGDRCTFEVLCRRIGVNDPAVRRLGKIVHDIDLKEDRYKDPHAATVSILIDGLRSSIPDDALLLEQGIQLFDALYCAFRGGRRGTPKVC